MPGVPAGPTAQARPAHCTIPRPATTRPRRARSPALTATRNQVQTATGTPNQPSAGWFLISPHPKGSPRARSGTTQSAKSGEPKRLQQFITSSTWDHAAVRRNIARWFAGSQPVEALVVDDTGFPRDDPA